MKKYILITLMLVLVLSLTAQGMKMHATSKKHCGEYPKMMQKRGSHGGAMMQRMLNTLDLNEKQQAKIEKLHMDHKKAEIDVDAKLKKLRIDKMAAMKNSDTKALNANIEATGALRMKKEKMKVKIMDDVKKLLNKEQLAKFQKLHAAGGRMKTHGDGMKKHGKEKHHGDEKCDHEDCDGKGGCGEEECDGK